MTLFRIYIYNSLIANESDIEPTHVNISVVLLVDFLFRVVSGLLDTVLHFLLQLPELLEQLGGVLSHGRRGFLQLVVFLQHNVVIARYWTSSLASNFETPISYDSSYCDQ